MYPNEDPIVLTSILICSKLMTIEKRIDRKEHTGKVRQKGYDRQRHKDILSFVQWQINNL